MSALDQIRPEPNQPFHSCDICGVSTCRPDLCLTLLADDTMGRLADEDFEPFTLGADRECVPHDWRAEISWDDRDPLLRRTCGCCLRTEIARDCQRVAAVMLAVLNGTVAA
jgi:hypothetical protein